MYVVQSSLTIMSSSSSHCLMNTCCISVTEQQHMRPCQSSTKGFFWEKLPKHKGHIQRADRLQLTSLSHTHTHIRMTAAVWVRVDWPSRTPTSWAFSGAFLSFFVFVWEAVVPKPLAGLCLSLLTKQHIYSEVHSCWDNRWGQRVTTCSSAWGLVVIRLVTLTLCLGYFSCLCVKAPISGWF